MSTPNLFQAFLNAPFDSDNQRYQALNQLRDAFNAAYPAFDFYLEDEWYPDGTQLEYRLRHKTHKTEAPRLAYDQYNNHRDAKGIWHLDDYQATMLDGSPDWIVSQIQQFLTQS